MHNQDRRKLLASLSLGGLLLHTTPSSHAKTHGALQIDPTLLTITGNITHHNRGGLDSAFDQLFIRHGRKFDHGLEVNATLLHTLKTVTIKPTLEYDGKPHVLTGPLLIDVLNLARPTMNDNTNVTLCAIDGYLVKLSVKTLKEQAFIVALTLDHKPLALGGLGPLWAVINPDSIPELAKRPLKERFSQCPWGIYHIQIDS